MIYPTATEFRATLAKVALEMQQLRDEHEKECEGCNGDSQGTN